MTPDFLLEKSNVFRGAEREGIAQFLCRTEPTPGNPIKAINAEISILKEAGIYDGGTYQQFPLFYDYL